MRIMTLHQRFTKSLHRLQGDYTLEIAAVAKLWGRVMQHYREPHRHYHTLAHIELMFGELDSITDRLFAPDLVALAIFYHDIIYDPTRSDNEAQSADLMQSELRFYLDPEQIAQVKALIMMTASHKWAAAEGIQKSDAAYFLDLDLSILGSSWDEYAQYTKAVRLEYRHVSDSDYQTGRTAVLQSLLARDRLYLSEDYHQCLESVARNNIRHELELLAV